jgi:hypothetical protein
MARKKTSKVVVKKDSFIGKKLGGAKVEILTSDDITINGKKLKQLSLVDGTTTILSEEDIKEQIS